MKSNPFGGKTRSSLPSMSGLQRRMAELTGAHPCRGRLSSLSSHISTGKLKGNAPLRKQPLQGLIPMNMSVGVSVETWRLAE